MQLIKSGSSKWVHDVFPEYRFFEWQEGDGAFSVGISEADRTIRYINIQAQRHTKKDFVAEFVSFLDVHSIEYEPKNVLD